MICRICRHTDAQHAHRGTNPASSWCVESACPCEAFKPIQGKRAALLALTLLACSAPPAEPPCVMATPQDCAYSTDQCESFCAHQCLSQYPCMDQCEAQWCDPAAAACPTTCEACVPHYTADGPYTLCEAPKS
jgi:hypothetical protein